MPMRARVTTILFALCAVIPTSGSVAAQEFRLTTFFDYYGGIEPSEGYENIRTRAYARPSFSGYVDRLNMEWALSGSLWVQPLGEPYAIDRYDILGETYVMFPFDYFDLTVGQKLVTYGFADVYGPLNTVNSTNAAPLSLAGGYDTRRPDPLVQLRLYPTFEDTIELTYVPITRPDREQLGDVRLPDTGDTVSWSDDPYLWETPHSVFFNYNRYGEFVDWQVFAGWYVDHTPDFAISTIDRSTGTTITPVYNRTQTYGIAYATRVGNSTLSQDVGVSITEDFAGKDLGAQDSDITVNTQFLTNLPGGVLGQFSVVYSFFFNHDQYDTGADEAAAEYLAEQVHAFHNQPLQHIAFVVGHFERAFLREKLQTELNIGFFFSPDIYIAPALEYAISDNWGLEMGADITLGDPPDTDLRRNPNNDNFYTRLVFRY